MRPNPFRTFPESVEIEGVHVPVNADFRVGVAIEMEMLEDKPDVAGLLLLFYKGVIPKNIGAAVDRMVWFYSHHDGQESTGAEEEQDRKNKSGRWYDFEQDSDALLASFMDAYGVDLSTAKMHWWAFRRLMLNLPPESHFMQRVHYRTADIKKLGKAQQKHYKKMRALYAIKSNTTTQVHSVEERDAALKEKMRKRYEDAQRQLQKKQQ